MYTIHTMADDFFLSCSCDIDEPSMTMADWNASPSFESLVVLELLRELPKDSLDWLLDKLTARRSEGGAELQIDVRLTSDGSKSNKVRYERNTIIW